MTWRHHPGQRPKLWDLDWWFPRHGDSRVYFRGEEGGFIGPKVQYHGRTSHRGGCTFTSRCDTRLFRSRVSVCVRRAVFPDPDRRRTVPDQFTPPNFCRQAFRSPSSTSAPVPGRGRSPNSLLDRTEKVEDRRGPWEPNIGIADQRRSQRYVGRGDTEGDGDIPKSQVGLRLLK